MRCKTHSPVKGVVHGPRVSACLAWQHLIIADPKMRMPPPVCSFIVMSNDWSAVH